MRRIGREGAFLALFVLSSLDPGVRADDAPKAEAAKLPDVDQVLERWRMRMASVTSVDVTFRQTSRQSPGFETKSTGRIVLDSSNFALIEYRSHAEAGKSSSPLGKTIWNGGRRLYFDESSNHVNRSRRRIEPTRPPFVFSVPFLFQLSVEEVQGRYDWEVLGENDGQVLLAATPKAAKTRALEPKRTLIFLDRASSLPVKFSFDHGPNDRDTYEITDLKLNTPIDPDLKNPCLDAWWIDDTPDWLAWLFR